MRRLLLVALIAGGLFLLVSTSISPKAMAHYSIVPGGMWINPGNNFTVTQKSNLHLAAHAYPTNPSDPSIAYVQFTAYWNGLTSSQWPVLKKVYPTPGTDVFSFDWNFTYKGQSIPSGAIEVSFDVYDTAGNVNLAPNGVHDGILNFYQLTQNNKIWSGYAAYSFSNNPIVYNDVHGQWTVNAIPCIKGKDTLEAQWVGLGNSNLEQIGTLTKCSNGVAYYYPVFEIINGSDPGVSYINKPVHAGDVVIAHVHYNGSGQYLLEETDQNQHWTVSGTLTGSTQTTAYNSAECILEDPWFIRNITTNSLSQFGTETFSFCTGNKMPISLAPAVLQFVILNDSGKPKVSVAMLNPASDQFSIKWLLS